MYDINKNFFSLIDLSIYGIDLFIIIDANITGLEPAEKYTIKVTPVSCLGGEGTPLTLSAKTTGEKPARPFIVKSENVALNKSFTVVNKTDSAAAVNIDKLFDGNLSVGRTDGTKDVTITVDLGKQYNIKRIYMKKCNGGGGQVYVANSADGTGKEPVGSWGWLSFDKSLTNDEFYRYVILDVGGNGLDFYELEVYADINCVEVLTGKPAFASEYHSDPFTANKAVDGDENTAWLVYSSTYPYWYADLEAEYYIDYIEITNSRSDDGESRRSFDIFGTNTKPSAETDWTSVHKYISKGTGEFMIFPFSGEVISSQEPYRYIGYRKTLNLGTATMNEIRAYSIAPEVSDVTLTSAGASIHFNEPMIANSLNPDEVKIYDLKYKHLSACTCKIKIL